ncbi:DUF3389 domain-containing protein [Vibrio sp. HA2012]|uniref:DUF3389 domain-containing protein n=1 Tax=Vibrio sp. HA2012 TaxID=1971595 RepID=UPI000C2BE14D|nr:DUF3389 domain-containing protein [Vibrio sp. HA2012]PJC87527.1 DUF3389 domain-containing protein [Vibrio sp. HA2012]
MVVECSWGKVIVTPFELVVRLEGKHMATMQAQTDAIQLIGRGANVIAANGSECKWSVKLDNEEQLRQIAAEMGCEI